MIAADHLLVGEALRAAMVSRAVETVLLPGWPPLHPPVPHPRPGDTGVLLVSCDLETSGGAAEACEVGRAQAMPWLVLTAGAPTLRWGQVLDAGARGVLGSDVGLDDLMATLGEVRAGRAAMNELERRSWLRRWRSSTVPEPLLRKAEHLSPEEAAMLTMLYEGTTVRVIACRFGVSEVAVRTQVQVALRRMASHD